MKKIRRRREGMTLVELIVSLALLSILMVMVVGVVSPAAKTFARMQQLQFAQLVLDNVEDEIKSQLQDAAGNIKIYNVSNGGNLVSAPGSDSGAVLEYVNTESYVVLMSADGCEETTLMQSGQVIGKESAAAGRLLLRYYWQKAAGSETEAYKYNYKEGGKFVARAAQQVFADKYYMGCYLKLTFFFPGGTAVGDEADYINVHAELYRDAGRSDLLASEDFIADLRYKATRIDGVTAIAE